MLLRKIDGEMNVQNCGFSAKWRRWRHDSRLTATAVITDSCHRVTKRWHVENVKNIASNDQTILIVHRNSANIACTFRFYVCLLLRDRDCCSAADVSSSCHAPASSYFEEMTRCRRQKLHWRWPGNPNGRSKFRNLGFFMFTRSQLTLRRRLSGRWRLSEIAQTARSRRQKHRQDDQIDRNSANTKIYAYKIKQNVSENFFLLLRITSRLTVLGTVFLSCYHSQRLLFSHSKNNFSTIEKQRYTYCRVIL